MIRPFESTEYILPLPGPVRPASVGLETNNATNHPVPLILEQYAVIM